MTSLLRTVVCPNCWHSYEPADSVWVASDHPSLADDPKLGEGVPRRFLPDRFDAAGNALDARGNACTEVACPRCHLLVPRACLELPATLLSVFGREGAGKSYFLAAMAWELRRMARGTFNLSFSDADPALNALLNENVASVFGRADGGDVRLLSSMIRKTQETGEQYRTVRVGGANQSYLQPFVFVARPCEGHPLYAEQTPSRPAGRVVCLYDNAGESFRPGADSSSAPVTRHLAKSEAMIFTFDPTQEAAFRPRLRGAKAGGFAAFRPQEPVLQEAAKRVRQFAGMGAGERDARPLIVVVTKSDAWMHTLSHLDPERPLWRKVRDDSKGVSTHVLDVAAIEMLSGATRQVLSETCGEIVAAAESFSEDVTYIPVSAVGEATQLAGDDEEVGVAAGDTRPQNAALPFLLAMAKSPSRLVAAGRKKQSA